MPCEHKVEIEETTCHFFRVICHCCQRVISPYYGCGSAREARAIAERHLKDDHLIDKSREGIRRKGGVTYGPTRL